MLKVSGWSRTDVRATGTDPRSTTTRSSTSERVAFVDGFDCTTAFAEEVRVYCIEPDAVTDSECNRRRLKSALEPWLFDRRIPPGQLTHGPCHP